MKKLFSGAVLTLALVNIFFLTFSVSVSADAQGTVGNNTGEIPYKSYTYWVDYSTNEKIFYPPEELDVSDAPQAGGGAGTLAYYQPWGDVVMFYGDFSPSGGLYGLGEAVSGTEYISDISGTVTLEAEE